MIAPDSFKGTATAAEAANAIARGWASIRPADELTLLPMADGGEGTLDAFAASVPAARRIPRTVLGPDGNATDAEWLLLPDGTAVVELALASGLTLLRELRPFDAHTYGFGELISAAIEGGARRLLLAVGGSSSTDGGAGALAALGARLLDAAGNPIPLGNRGLGSLATADLSSALLAPENTLVLCDVQAPLLGPNGAAAVFAPQKGAAPGDLPLLEANLAHFASIIGGDPELPGSGAAGGTAFGLVAWGAQLTSGAAEVAVVGGFEQALGSADLVVTGEGRFDAQSAAGKIPHYVAETAARAGVPSALVAGVIEASTAQFVSARSLVELAGDPESALGVPIRWLEAAGVALARDFARGPA